MALKSDRNLNNDNKGIFTEKFTIHK